MASHPNNAIVPVPVNSTFHTNNRSLVLLLLLLLRLRVGTAVVGKARIKPTAAILRLRFGSGYKHGLSQQFTFVVAPGSTIEEPTL